jgi:hypothetical protein
LSIFKISRSDMNIDFSDTEMRRDANLTCPSCQSKKVHLKNSGRRIGSAIGTVAGAAAGASAALSGAEAGAVIGLVAGPTGAAVGGLVGAIFGGLFGASAGCIGGAKVGETFDRTALENLACLDCGHSFSST